MHLLWTIALLGSVGLQLVLCEEEAAKAPVDPEFQKLFTNFFDPSAGSTYFYKFIEEGKKAFKIADGKEEPASEKTEAQKEEQKKNKVSLSAKVFAFFGKAYGCQHSKIAKAFLTDYKKGETGFPKEPDATADDKWLQKIAETADTITTDEDLSVPIADAEGKFSGLSPDQRDVLIKGEEAMPLSSQIYLHFIRAVGCSNTNEPKYQKFKTEFKELVKTIEAKGLKTPPNSKYWLVKADAVILDAKTE